MQKFPKFSSLCQNISKKISSFDMEDLSNTIEIIENLRLTNGKLIIVGNGGSASIASHVSVDFVNKTNIRAINFNEPNLITCLANDYGYSEWVSKAIDKYCDKRDIALLISSSGESKNILNAAKAADILGMQVITFSGFSRHNSLQKLGKVNFWVNSTEYNEIEMVHHIWLVALTEHFSSK